MSDYEVFENEQEASKHRHAGEGTAAASGGLAPTPANSLVRRGEQTYADAEEGRNTVAGEEGASSTTQTSSGRNSPKLTLEHRVYDSACRFIRFEVQAAVALIMVMAAVEMIGMSSVYAGNSDGNLSTFMSSVRNMSVSHGRSNATTTRPFSLIVMFSSLFLFDLVLVIISVLYWLIMLFTVRMEFRGIVCWVIIMPIYIAFTLAAYIYLVVCTTVTNDKIIGLGLLENGMPHNRFKGVLTCIGVFGLFKLVANMLSTLSVVIRLRELIIEKGDPLKYQPLIRSGYIIVPPRGGHEHELLSSQTLNHPPGIAPTESAESATAPILPNEGPESES